MAESFVSLFCGSKWSIITVWTLNFIIYAVQQNFNRGTAFQRKKKKSVCHQDFVKNILELQPRYLLVFGCTDGSVSLSCLSGFYLKKRENNKEIIAA